MIEESTVDTGISTPIEVATPSPTHQAKIDLMEEKKRLFHMIEEFQGNIAFAKMNKEEWVEAPPEVIKYFNRAGLNGAEHFIFEGIMVCAIGTKDGVIQRMNEDIGKRTFGKQEGIRLGTA